MTTYKITVQYILFTVYHSILQIQPHLSKSAVMQTVAHAAVFCTKARNVTGNKYKFVQIVKKQLPQGPDWSVAKEKKCMCYNGTCIWQLKVYV